MIGQLINKYQVRDSYAGKDRTYKYKTLKGAERKYDELDSIKDTRTGWSAHNVALYQETDVRIDGKDELVAIKSNWFGISE